MCSTTRCTWEQSVHCITSGMSNADIFIDFNADDLILFHVSHARPSCHIILPWSLEHVSKCWVVFLGRWQGRSILSFTSDTWDALYLKKHWMPQALWLPDPILSSASCLCHMIGVKVTGLHGNQEVDAEKMYRCMSTHISYNCTAAFYAVNKTWIIQIDNKIFKTTEQPPTEGSEPHASSLWNGTLTF